MLSQGRLPQSNEGVHAEGFNEEFKDPYVGNWRKDKWNKEKLGSRQVAHQTGLVRLLQSKVGTTDARPIATVTL